MNISRELGLRARGLCEKNLFHNQLEQIRLSRQEVMSKFCWNQRQRKTMWFKQSERKKEIKHN